MKSKNKSAQNNILLHPAFDIKDDVLVLGFQDKDYNQAKEKTISYNIYLFASKREGRDAPLIDIKMGLNHINHNDTTYIFDAKTDNKERHLVNINSRWSKEIFESAKNGVKTVSSSQIYNTLYNEVKSYLELEKEEDYHILTSWIIGTYFFISFKAYPYIHIKGMKGSGKTTALDVMRLTCFNAFKERSTMPSFRDNVDSQRGTALIDQADKRFGTQSEDDMVDVMVDSYKASSGMMSKMVLVKNKQVRTEYNAFVPKAFASIKELNFDLKDRCIQIQFIKSKFNKNQLDGDNPIWLNIRDSLYSLLILNYINIKKYVNDVERKCEDDAEIVGRNAELWKPIETIMRFCSQSEEVVEKVKKVYKSKIVFVQDGISSLERAILDYVTKSLEGKESDWIAVKNIVNELILVEDDEWGEKSFRSRTQFVGNLISRMNLHSSKKHGNGGNYYLFEKDKLEKIKNAYIDDTEVDLSPVFTPLKNPIEQTEF